MFVALVKDSELLFRLLCHLVGGLLAGWLLFWADIFTDRKNPADLWDEKQTDIWDISGVLPCQISVNLPE